MNDLALIHTSVPTPSEEKAVAFFGSFSTELAAIKKANSTFVFDLDTKKGREECRSHIHKLRKSRVAIEKAGKAERADAIAYQKAIIAEEDGLTAEIVEMIDFHEKPLKEWEEKEAARIENIRIRIEGMKVTADFVLGKSSAELKARLAEIGEIATGIGFDEFADQAYAMKTVAVDQLQGYIASAEAQEAAAARLAQLEAEAEERRKADEAAAEAKRIEDARIAAEKAEAERVAQEAKDAADREAKRIADEKAEQERIEAAQKQAAEDARLAAEAEAAQREEKLRQDAENARLAQKAAEEQREADRIAAENQRAADAKAAQDRQDAAVAAEQQRLQRLADEQAAEDARKAADRAHRGKIHSEIATAIFKVINDKRLPGSPELTEDYAKQIVIAICGDVIPHLHIKY